MENIENIPSIPEPSVSRGRFFSGHTFPLLGLSLLISVSILVGVLILFPATDGALGAFAADFRKWCFGADEDSDALVSEIMFFLDPLVLGLIIFIVWRRTILEAPRRAVILHSFISFAAVFAAAAFFALTFKPVTADSVHLKDLRTSLAGPAIRLTNQAGRPVSLADYRGRVVLITAFYTTCHNTCPLIINQIKKAVEAQKNSDDLTVMALTLDPEHDTVQTLAAASRSQNLPLPRYQLLTGDSGQVHDLLTTLSIGSRRNLETNAIDHANVILLTDRNGRIAFRLGLGPAQEKLLTEAVTLLLEEKRSMQ